VSASFPALEEVGYGDLPACGMRTQDGQGLLFNGNLSLTTVRLPQLKRVQGRVYMGENPSLEAVCLPALTEVVTSSNNDASVTDEALHDPAACLSEEFARNIHAEPCRTELCP
jgi:hypothetical protein